jgi:hypothetical protein
MATSRPYQSTIDDLKRGVIALTAYVALAYAIAALLGARGILLLVSPLIAAFVLFVIGQVLGQFPRARLHRGPDQRPGAGSTAGAITPSPVRGGTAVVDRPKIEEENG